MRRLARRPASTRPLAAAAVLLAAVLGPGRAAAQDPAFVLEGRGGAALPVASFRSGPDQGGRIGHAPSFGVHFVYRGPSGWGPYVGFSQHRFDCGADGCPGGDYVATTWDLGMQRTLGRRGWARAGAVFGRLERRLLGGPAASSLSLGAEAGIGLRLPLPGRMALTPGLRLGWLNTRFRDDGLVRMRWVAADLGVVLGF